MPRKKKRRKKNTEILKIDTDISEAEIARNALKQKLRSIQLKNMKSAEIMKEIRRKTAEIPPGTLKMSLNYATRDTRVEEVVTM